MPGLAKDGLYPTGPTTTAQESLFYGCEYGAFEQLSNLLKVSLAIIEP